VPEHRFPTTIHAVTPRGFALTIHVFVLAYSINHVVEVATEVFITARIVELVPERENTEES
jgi:hypothetical protein